MSMETSQTEIQSEENENSRIYNICGYNFKACKCVIGKPEGEGTEKRAQKIFQAIIAKNFPKLMRSQNTHSGSSENTKQNKYQIIYT